MFHNNIKKIRESKHFGVNELSRRSGVNASYISALERGEKHNPTINTLKKIADALSVKIDDLLSNSVTNEKIKNCNDRYSNIKEFSEIFLELDNETRELIIKLMKKILNL